MPMLHDADYRGTILNRIRALRPDSERRWGKMTVDQMLWHVNEALESALGKISLPPDRTPLPRPLMKFLILNVPWPKGAPTMPQFQARAEHDFEAERTRCLRLVEELCAKPLGSAWPDSPTLGRMSGRDVTRLQAKHLDHHLRQFGV
jgi:DinB superfamily